MRPVAMLVLALALYGAARPDMTVPPRGLDLFRPSPPDNRATSGRVALGRRLFFDRRLSRDGSRSCADCHRPKRAFGDGRKFGVGVGGAVTDRNVPALINRAWGTAFFWDGRAVTLEEQVIQPILSANELGMSARSVVSLARTPHYLRQFQREFATQNPGVDDVARALASYVRSIMSGDSPFDRYEAGQNRALPANAVRGLVLFRGRAGCSACHLAPLFSDEQFHNTGVAWRSGAPSDRGRARVTSRPEDVGAFKTPSLRHVGQTAPYMHDGSLATLRDVVDFYDRGGEPNTLLDSRVRPLHLSEQEKGDLEAFLHSLTGHLVEGR